MVEFGYLNLLLTVWNGNDVISIQPFNVLIYDDYMGGASSFIELIQELQRLIENMVIDLNDAIKITEKGKPDGVASLDKDGKLPVIQLPKEFEEFLKHIDHTVFEHHVHGLKLDDDGLLMYLDKNDNWQYVGFSDTGVGGASPLNAEIEVKDGIAKITYIGIPTVAQSKWSTGDRITSYFLLNGTTFTGTSFPVSLLGVHTLYYKDSNGVEYVKPFNVTSAMLGKPNVDIKVDDGYVTVTIPTTVNVATKKWAKGSRDIPYFAYNGTVFTGNTFQVTEVGTYTVYIKTATGVEYVYVVDVTQDMLPIISKPSIRVTNIPFHYDTIAGYSATFYVKDSNYKIVKFKDYNSSTYVNLDTPIEKGVEKFYSGISYSIDFSLTSNKNKSIIFGFENEIGQRAELHLYADNNYLYFWIDDGNAGISTILESSSLNKSTSISFPSSINGRIIDTIGVSDNAVMYRNEYTKNVTIPSSIQTLFPIYANSYELENVTVLSSNVQYIPYGDIDSFKNSVKQVIMKSMNNSTTKDFVDRHKNNSAYKLTFQSTN